MKEVKINLNDMVKFKLTDKGKQVWHERFEKVRMRLAAKGIFPTIWDSDPKVDEDGYTTCQLHDFMGTFGKHMTVGVPNIIDPIDLIFEVEE